MNEPSSPKRVVWAELVLDQSALKLHEAITQLRTQAREHVEMAHRLKIIGGATTSLASDVLCVLPAFDNKDKTMALRDAKIHSSREKIVANITNRPLLVCSKGPNKIPKIGEIGRVNIRVNDYMGSPQLPTPRQLGLAAQSGQSEAPRGRSLQRQTTISEGSTVPRSSTPQRQITVRCQNPVARSPSPQRQPTIRSIDPGTSFLLQSDRGTGTADVPHQRTPSPQRQMTIHHQSPVARTPSPQRQPTILSVVAGPPFVVPPPAPRRRSPQGQMTIHHQSSVARAPNQQRQPTIRSIVPSRAFLGQSNDGRLGPPPPPRRKKRMHPQRGQQRQLSLWQGIAAVDGTGPPIVCAPRDAVHSEIQGRAGTSVVNVSAAPWRALLESTEEESAPPITYVPARILTWNHTGSNTEYKRYEALVNPKVEPLVAVGLKRRRESDDQGGDEQPPTNRKRPLERSGAVANLAMGKGI
ncbi:hypothetical protein DFH06DRAFT_1327004 [Mycena polygramma]|nr:hypothetical protein DFH06DRAFT_1327004 [Mycena polygramma]